MTNGQDRAEASVRGDLLVADRVVQKIAGIAAGEVRGVVSTGSGVDQLLGRKYPHADATIAGSRARIQIDIAVAWPYPLSQVSSQVRDHVTDRVNDLVGLTVDAVDVTVSKVVHASAPQPRRVE